MAINSFEKFPFPCRNCDKQAHTFLPSNLVRGTVRTECSSCGWKGEIQYNSHDTSEGVAYEYMWTRKRKRA